MYVCGHHTHPFFNLYTPLSLSVVEFRVPKAVRQKARVLQRSIADSTAFGETVRWVELGEPCDPTMEGFASYNNMLKLFKEFLKPKAVPSVPCGAGASSNATIEQKGIQRTAVVEDARAMADKSLGELQIRQAELFAVTQPTRTTLQERDAVLQVWIDISMYAVCSSIIRSFSISLLARFH